MQTSIIPDVSFSLAVRALHSADARLDYFVRDQKRRLRRIASFLIGRNNNNFREARICFPFFAPASSLSRARAYSFPSFGTGI